MATSRKLTSVKIETSSGTLTDLTPFITSVESKPYKPSIWRRLFIWIEWQWFSYKANRAWKKISKEVALEIEFVKRPREPWRWN
jgi:hypothetical protein